MTLPREQCWRCGVPTTQPSTVVLQTPSPGQPGDAITRRTLCLRCAGELVRFVMSLNLHRRHLTASQRAEIAAEIKPQLEAEIKAKEGRRKSKNDFDTNIKVDQPADENRPRNARKEAAMDTDSPTEATEATEVGTACPDSVGGFCASVDHREPFVTADSRVTGHISMEDAF